MTTDCNEEMVTVPKDLLKRVLNEADLNNGLVEDEFACSRAEHKEHDEIAARIQALRDAAGIAEDAE